jgi:phage shock protein PspC (stress-responsive transcriptional regulator)
MFKSEFRKLPTNNGLLGVCSGIAYALGVKVWLVRALFFLACVFTGFIAFWIYLILALCVPEWKVIPKDYLHVCE